MRPLRNAEAIYHILLNSDLAVTEEFKEAEIDEEIIEALAADLLVQVSQALLKQTFRPGETEPVQEKTVTLAKQFASALNLAGSQRERVHPPRVCQAQTYLC